MDNNVLFFIEGLNFGGQQTYMHNVLKRVSSLKMHTAYFLNGEMYQEYKDISLSMNRINTPTKNPKDVIIKPWLFVRILYNLVRIIRQKKINVIITNAFITYMFGSIAKLFVNVKVIRIIGGDLVRNEAFHFVKTFHWVPLHLLTDRFFGWSAMLRLHQQKGVPSYKLVNTPTASVDINHFLPFSQDEVGKLRHQFNIPDKHIVIGWVGRIEPDLEFFHTVEMLKILKERAFTYFTFFVVGDGSYKSILEDTLKKLNLYEHTIFVGKKQYSEIRQYYGAIDVEVLLDKDPQGGSHLREAMACGKVVLTTNGTSGVQSEFIENAKTGFLVPPEDMYNKAADIVIFLQQNKDVLIRVGENAHIYAKNNMSFDSVAQILEKECHVLVNGHE